MTPPIAFRSDKNSDLKGSVLEIRPPTAVPCATRGPSSAPSTSVRSADYAYRIAALTAGLVLLATVM